MIPIIGNTFVKNTLDTKIKNLQSQGIQVIKSDANTGYLSTSRHYELLLHTNTITEGIRIGIDMKYSNIPLFNELVLDVYPLALSSDTMKNLKEKDSEFSKYIEAFLFNKGLLCHIEYELISRKFSGYLKDITENHTLQNNAKVIANVKGVTFTGVGDLLTPSSLEVVAKTIDIKFLNEEEMSIFLKNLSALSSIQEKISSLSFLEVDTLAVHLKRLNQDKQSLEVSKIFINISSNTQGKEAEIHTKFSFDKMQAHLKNLDINASFLNYDLRASHMDNESFEVLRNLVSQARTSNSVKLNAKIKNSFINVLSKGIKVDIVDFSIKTIVLNNEDIKGFTIASKIDMEEDSSLVAKMMLSPLLILGNIDFDVQSSISQKILHRVIRSSSLLFFIQRYTKRDKEEVKFDVSYRQGNLKVDGKIILGK